MNENKVRLLSYLVDNFNEDTIHSSSILFFEITHVVVQMVSFMRYEPLLVVKSGLLIDGFILTPTFYNAASSVIEDALSVAVHVLERVFARDFSGPNGISEIELCLGQAKKELRRHMGSKGLLLFRLSCAKYEEKGYIFQYLGSIPFLNSID